MKVRTKSTVWRAVWPVVIDAILIQEGGIQTPPQWKFNLFKFKITKNRHWTLLVNRIIARAPFWKMFWIRLCIYGIFLKIYSRYTLFYIGWDNTFYLGKGGGYMLFFLSLEEDDNFAQINLFDLLCYRKYPKIIYQRNFVLELFTCSSQCNHKSW